ncbi:uncharacterized protein TNCV_3859851 [Trichonephila clavipes]|nr:uncharacterized protein TNCV_3859851 [Trichonephila clavipes]
MDDNATCHRTLSVQDCLDSEGIQSLVWPARSPDLNPSENVWDALGRQVAGRNYPPTNKNTLIRALAEEWDKLPQQLLDNVVQSMDTFQRTGKVSRRRIRAHYEQLSVFERGRIIGLKKAGWANRRITRHMGQRDAAIRRSWQEWVDSGKFLRHNGCGRPRVTANRDDSLIVI